MNIISLWPMVGVPVARSVAGWIENALEDGKISSFEWAQLGSTIVRVGIISTGMYFGLNGAGVNIDALGSAAGAVILDFILKAIKNTGKKK
jgi:hypothetical protein